MYYVVLLCTVVYHCKLCTIEPLQGVYMVTCHDILGKLPLVSMGDTGTFNKNMPAILYSGQMWPYHIRSTQWYTMIHHSTQWYTVVHNGTQWYTMVLNGTQWYITVQKVHLLEFYPAFILHKGCIHPAFILHSFCIVVKCGPIISDIHNGTQSCHNGTCWYTMVHKGTH